MDICNGTYNSIPRDIPKYTLGSYNYSNSNKIIAAVKRGINTTRYLVLS